MSAQVNLSLGPLCLFIRPSGVFCATDQIVYSSYIGGLILQFFLMTALHKLDNAA